MAFNDLLFNKPASQGEVAGVAINVAIALDRIIEALDAIKQGEDLEPLVEEIRKRSGILNKAFDRLTGYTPESSE